jgi:hypothetical protein
MPLNIAIKIPKYVLDRYRPGHLDSGESHRVIIPLWSGFGNPKERNVEEVGIPLIFEAHLYQCPVGHKFKYWLAQKEDRPNKVDCAECDKEANGLTIYYRWEREGSVDFCRGCGAGWNRQTQSAEHKTECPYEIIKSKE